MTRAAAPSARRGFVQLLSWGLLGKVVALGREVLFAAAYGAGPTASAFRVAQTATFVPVNLLTSDLLSAAFLPRYTALHAEDPRAARRVLWSYLLVLGSGSLVLAAVLHAAAPALTAAVAPGLSASTSGTAADLLAGLAWCCPLIVVSALLGYALVADGSYGLLAARPLLQSGGLVLGTAAAVVTGHVQWLATGFTAAWAGYLLLCVHGVHRRRLLHGPTGLTAALVAACSREAGRVVRPLLALPLLLQATIVLERVLSSLVSDSTVAAVDYAKVVTESVIGLVAVPLGVLGLAELPRRSAAEQREVVDRVTRQVLLLLVPASAVLVAAAPLVVEVLYGRGQLDGEGRRQITLVLLGLAAGLWAQVLGYVLVKALTAQGRTREVLACMAPALAAQAAVQALALTALGPVALGLGPSAYGLVLVATAGRRLGTGAVLRSAARRLVVPAALSALVLVLVAARDAGPYAAVALVLLVWAPAAAGTLGRPAQRRLGRTGHQALAPGPAAPCRCADEPPTGSARPDPPRHDPRGTPCA